MAAHWLWGAQATCTWGYFTVGVAVITGSHGEGRYRIIPLLYMNQILHTDAVSGAQNLS